MSDGIVDEVRGTCKVGGSNYGLSGVRAEITVNNWPNVTAFVTVGATSSGAAKQIDTSIFKIIGGWQNSMLNGQLRASVHWNDDMGVSDGISGYAVSVSQAVQYGNMCAQVTVLPDYTEVDAVNLMQYRSAIYATQKRDHVDASRPKLKSGLMGYIKDIVEWMLKRWDEKQATLTEGMSDAEKKMYSQQHSINQNSIHYFYELLDNSDVGSEYTKSSMSVIGVEATSALCETIVNCLCQGQGSFLSTIVALANQFRLLYVPDTDSIGKYISKSEMMDGNEKSGNGGKNAVVQASSAMGSSGYLPVTTVFTLINHNAGNMRNHVIGRSAQGGAATIGDGTTGRTIQISPPLWIPRLLNVAKVKNDGTSPKKQAVRPGDQKSKTDEVIEQQQKASSNYFLIF